VAAVPAIAIVSHGHQPNGGVQVAWETNQMCGWGAGAARALAQHPASPTAVTTAAASSVGDSGDLMRALRRSRISPETSGRRTVSGSMRRLWGGTAERVDEAKQDRND
jgi:hypothetical protein